MPESIEDFAARAQSAQTSGGRLPLDPHGMPLWDVFPFDASELRVKELRGVGEELPRMGEAGGPECHCVTGDSGDWREVWSNGRWQVKVAPVSGSALVVVLEPFEHVDLDELSRDRAAELGVLTVGLVRAIEALPSVGRCHVSRWGDGGAHAHVWFIARPLGMTQLRGTYMALWDDLLPPMPTDVRDDNLAAVLERFRAYLED